MAISRIGAGPGSIQKAMGSAYPATRSATGGPAVPVVPAGHLTAPTGPGAGQAAPQPLVQPSFDPFGKGTQKKPLTDKQLAKIKQGPTKSSIGAVVRDVFNKSLYTSDALENFKNSKSKSPTYRLMRKFFKPHKRGADAFRDAVTKWAVAGAAEGSLFSLTYNYRFEEGAAGHTGRGSVEPTGWFKNAKAFRTVLISLYNEYLERINVHITDWDDDTQVVVGGLFIYLPLTFIVMRANYSMLGLLQAGKLAKSRDGKLEGFKNTLTRAKMTRVFDGIVSMLLNWKTDDSVQANHLRKMFKLVVYYLTVHNLKE